jgi:hypothetical protein
MKKCAHWALAGVLALAASGCSDDEPDVPVVVVSDQFGTLSTEWLALGSTNPANCSAVGADRFELLIYDEFGGFFSEAEAPCSSFSLSVELPVGRFSADATLVDVFDRAVSTTRTLDDLLIVRDTDLVVTVDFAPGSIL